MPTLSLRCVDAHARTHVGHVRDHNEDAVISDPARGVFVLADGMGGLPAGEVASSIACAEAHRALTGRVHGASRHTSMLDAFAAADGVVRERSSLDPRLRGMGTTLAAVVVSRGRACVGHAGDSRVYLWRAGVLTRLTQDHGSGHVVMRAIGVGPGPSPDVRSIELAPGDVLMLCSDGLHGPLRSAGIERVLRREPCSCAVLSAKLIEAALEAGGPDNVTVAIARFG
jgi:PPM family protein phosphatase